MVSGVKVKVAVSVDLRPEIVEQIRLESPEVVHSNWLTMASVMHRRADLRPEEHSSRTARRIAQKYDEEASQIATAHNLALA